MDLTKFTLVIHFSTEINASYFGVKQIFTRLTALMHFGTETNDSHPGVKRSQRFKLEGHSSIQCAGNSTLRVESYSIWCVVSSSAVRIFEISNQIE